MKFLTDPRFLLAFLVVIFALNLGGVRWNWYASVPWLDNLHHGMGGFWIGALTFYLAGAYPRLVVLPAALSGIFLVLLGFAALAGAAWELYEFWFYDTLAAVGVIPPPQFGHGDTVSDLFFDLLGAAIAAAISHGGRGRLNP